MKALFAAAAKPRLSEEAINWASGAKSGTQSSELSFEPLSITRILTPVVVATTDSMHTFSKSPEFQLMIATVLRMFCREHQHDINGFTRNVRRETPPARGIQGTYRESRFITRFKLAYLPMLRTSPVSKPYSASNRAIVLGSKKK